MDMHSGGGTKEAFYEKILIEAPEDEAKVIFYNRFGHNPERVSCTCCGDDYSISSEEDLAQLTGYDRGCISGDVGKGKNKKHFYAEPNNLPEDFKKGDFQPLHPDKYIPLKKYLKLPTVLVIRSKDIKSSERSGSVPEQGYCWVD